MKIYIASSWKNQHAVELLTAKLRENDFDVISWIENNYGEDHGPEGTDFEKWIKTKPADRSFKFDTEGANKCDIFVYLGPAGKDAAAECGIAYGRKMSTKDDALFPMYALWAKGEDFGLMRKMFDIWCARYEELIKACVVYRTGMYAGGHPDNPFNAFNRKPHIMDFEGSEDFDGRMRDWWNWERENNPHNTELKEKE